MRLKLDNSLRLLIVAIVLIFTNKANAIILIWDGSNGTSWNNPANWSGNTVPLSGDDVIIDFIPGSEPVIDVTTVTLGSLTINLNATLTCFTANGASTLTVNGAFQNNGHLVLSNTISPNTVLFSGDVSGSGDIRITGTMAHAITFNGVNNALGAGIDISGNTGATNIRYSRLGDQQVIPTNYRNLIIEGTGIKTFTGSSACTVALSMTISNASGGCTFNMGTATPSLTIQNNLSVNASCVFDYGTVIAKNVRVAAAGGVNALVCAVGSTFNMTGAGLAHNLFISGTSTNSCPSFITTNGSGSTVTYDAAGAQTIFKSMEYQNLTIAGTGTKNVATAAGDLRLRGNLLVNGGTLNYNTSSFKSYIMGNATINSSLLFNATAVNSLFINGNLSGTGTLSLQNAGDSLLLGGATNTIGTYSSSSAAQVVYYNRNGAQTAFATTAYPKLVIGGSGVKTLSGNATCTSLDINSGSTLTLGGNFTDNGVALINGTLDDAAGGGKTIAISGNLGGTGTINLLGSNTLNLSGASNAIGTLSTIDGTASTVSYLAGAAQTVFASANYQNVSFSGSTVKTLAGNSIIRADLSVAPGTTFDASNNNIEILGNWYNQGTFIAGTGSVRFIGNTVQSVEGGTFNLLDIQNTASTVRAQTPISATSGTTIAPGATLDLNTVTGNGLGTVSGTGILSISALSGTAETPPSGPFFAAGGGTLVYYGSMDFQLPPFTCNNLLINGPSNKSLTAAITVNKDLKIETGSTLSGGSFSIDLYGDYIQDGLLVAGTCSLQFKNTSLDQFIKGTGFPAFGTIVIDKAPGRAVILNNAIAISTALDFQAGILDVFNYDLTFSSGALITGNDVSRYILTNSTGRVLYDISSPSGTYSFPVAVGGVYAPAVLTMTSGGFSAGSYIGLKATAGEDPNVLVAGKSLSNHWTVFSNSVSALSGNFQFTYDPTIVQGNEAAYVGARYNGSWVSGAPLTVNTASNLVTVPYTSAPDIAGGYTAGEPTVFSFTDLYSIQTGNWEDPTTWAYGGYAATTCNCVPGAGSVVHIGGNRVVTKSTGTNYGIDTLYIDATGTLDVGAFPGSISMSVFTNKGNAGNGRIRISDIGFPSIATNDFCNSAGTGFGTVEFYGGSYNFYPLTIFPNLHIFGSGTKTAGSPSLLVQGNFTVNGNAFFSMGSTLTSMTVTGTSSISGGSSLIFSSGPPKLFVNTGDFLCSGSLDMNGGNQILELRGVNNDIGSLTSGTGTIRYNSASAQNMSTFTNGYYNLEVSGGGVKTLRAVTEVYNGLIMNGAVINLGTNDLIVYNPATITGTFSNTNNIRVTSTGIVILDMAGAAPTFNRTVPVATNTNYMPVTINLSAFSVATGEIRIQPLNGVHPNVVTPSVALLGHWNISSTGLSGISGSLTFEYQSGQVQGTEANYQAGYYDGSSWATSATVTPGSNLVAFNKVGVATLTGGYTAGEPAAFVPATITTTNPSFSEYCIGAPITGNFTITGTFFAGNNFELELSTPAGGFPGTIIGTVTSTTATPIAGTLPGTSGANYKIRVNSTNPAVNGSQSAVFAVNPAIGNNTIAAAQAYCAPTDPSLLTGSTPTGGNGTFNFQWETSSDNISFTPIAGANAQNYDPALISVTTYFRRVVTSGTCTHTSASIDVQIHPAVDAGTVTANQSFCSSGNPVAFSETLAPSGGNGTYVFQWESAAAIGGPYTAIGGATSNVYDAPLVTTTTYYRRKVTSSSCAAVYSTPITVTVIPPATSNANADQTICAGSTATLSGSATNHASYSWSSPTAGTFTPNASTFNAVYTPSAADITAGTVVLTLTATGNTPCGTAVDQMTLSVVASPTSNANSDQTICATSTASLNGIATNYSALSWTTTGTGTFSNNSILNPVYTPSAADKIAGSVTLTLQANGNTPCAATSDGLLLSFVAAPTVNAGADIAVCQPNNANITAATVTNSPSVSWSVIGGGTFSPNITTLNPTYTQVVPGTYTLTLTANGNAPCASVTDDIVVTVNPTPTATASSNSPVCAGGTLNLSCAAPGAASFSWTGPNAFSSATQNPIVGAVSAASAGVYSVTATSSSGCVSSAGTVSVTVNPVPAAPTPSYNNPVCEGDPINLSATTVAGATYAWTGPLAFSSNVQNPTIASSTLSNGGSYGVTATVSGCTSSSSSVIVTVNPIPSTPVITGSAALCVGQTAIFNVIDNAGSSYAWTVPSGTSILGNGTHEITATVGLNSGNVEVTETSAAGCVSPLASLPVTVSDIPAQPSVITGPAIACETSLGNNYSVVNDLSASSYNWTYSGGGATLTPSSNTVSIDFSLATDGDIQVEAVNGCGTSTARLLSVDIIAAPATPSPISGVSNYCENTTANIFDVTNDPAATSYSWSYTGTGASFSSTTNSISVDFATGATSGDFVVTATNGCGNSAASIKTITVSSIPALPGAINGTASACEASVSNPFDVTNDPNATSYAWSYTGTGATIGGTTNTISVSFGTGATSGNLEVTASNACGTSGAQSLPITITNIPAQPSIIGGNLTPCEGTVSNSYGVLTDINATNYVWSYTGTGHTISGTTNTISVDYASGATSGDLQVMAQNGCGTSPVRSESITVMSIPATPSVITGPTTGCTSTTITYSVVNDPSATSYSWTYPGASITNLGNSADIIFPGVSASNLDVTANNLCGSSLPSSLSLTINSIPSQPAAINGPVSVCEGLPGNTYDVTNDPTATTYNWTYTGTGHTIFGTTNAVTVDFAMGATSGNIEVTAQNACGTSPSQTASITVNLAPLTPSGITGSMDVCENTFSNPYSVVNDPLATAYNWSFNGSGHTISGTTDAITIDFATGAISGTLSVSAVNGCGISSASTLPITVKTIPANPGAFTSSSLVVCQGTSYPYSVNSDPNVDFYNWSYTGTGLSFSDNSNAPSGSYSAIATSGDISVTAQNICGVSTPATITITVNPIPAQPSPITGLSSVCVNQMAVVYSVVNDPLATGYSYTYSGTGYNLAPAGPPGVCNMDFLATATSGSLSIVASNACGNSPASLMPINVNDVPAQPAGFTGPLTVCENTTNNSYTVANDPGATSYTWTYSGTGATINGTSSAITVDFASGATNGILDVMATNLCGNSATLSSPISISPLPLNNLGLDAASDTVCFSINGTLGILNTENGISYQAFSGGFPIGSPVTGNGATQIITLPYGSLVDGANTITVDATGVCVNSVTLTNTKTVYRSSHNSSSPSIVSVATSLCVAGTVTLGVTNVAGYTYTWYQGTSEIIGQTGNNLDVLVPGNYVLTITDNYLCPATSSAIPVNVGITIPSVAMSNSSTELAQFTATVPAGSNIQWYAVTGTGNKRIQGEITTNYTAYYNGQYYVVAFLNGCYVPSNVVALGSMTWGALERHMLNVDNETINLPVPDFSKELSLYPNPSAGNFSVSYKKNSDAKTQFELYNQLGKLMYSQEISGSGLTITDVSLPGITSGLYQIVIREGDQTTHSTIMIE